MKYLITKIVFLSLMIVLSSCEETLEEVPYSFISSANFYQTEEDAKAAITGAYARLIPNYYTLWYQAMLLDHAEYNNARGSQAPISDYSQILNSVNQNRTRDGWVAHYDMIARANTIIAKVPDIPMNENLKTQIIGEAHFLRALSYFNLVRGWGPIPLRKKAIEGLEDIEGTPRAPTNEVYDFIIEEAKMAEEVLPSSYPNENGRATVWAAKMLLADVYLTMGNWSEAKDKAAEIIDNSPFYLLEISESDDFYQIFEAGMVSHCEDIWSIHHSETTTNTYMNFMHVTNSPYSATGGIYAWLPNMNSFLGTWDSLDLRKDLNLYEGWYDSDGNWIPLPASSPILFKKFIDREGPADGSIPIYRFSEALLFYAEAANEAEGGPSAIALEYLNRIKRRGYGYPSDQPSPVDYPNGLSKAEFSDAVFNERGYELLLEGKRWWDLIRTGRAAEVTEAATGKPFNNDRLLWPIPLDEINNNSEIDLEDQNPGY